MPPTLWGKVLSATPVVLTVVATMLAGLSSSEMNRAQYDRSLAAQLQSKAGDQWNFFQGKKLRGAVQRNTLDTIASTSESGALTAVSLAQALNGTTAAALVETPEGRAALSVLSGEALPLPAAATPLDSSVEAALHALENARPDGEMADLVNRIDVEVLDAAVKSARAQTLALDAATGPLGKTIDVFEKWLSGQAGTSPVRRDFTIARLGFNSRRYDAEARLNQMVAELYELQVRKSNLSAERHHRRSQVFFYGMLAAQMGVIISTLAMAARNRNLLWSLAAGAGVIAIGFALYVYLYV